MDKIKLLDHSNLISDLESRFKYNLNLINNPNTSKSLKDDLMKDNAILNSMLRHIPQFTESVNATIKEINELIDEYNQMIQSSASEESRLAILRNMMEQKIHIERFHNDKLISLSQGFTDEIQINLFHQLKKELQALGSPIVSTNNQASSSNATYYEFTELLNTMSPEKVNQLLAILVSGNLIDLNQLYQPNEPEADLFQQFLENNQINFLGGSNTKNFKISPINGSKPYVIKIENRMGNDKSAEHALRSHPLFSNQFLAKIDAERLAVTGIVPDRIVRYIQVTSFFHGGDLLMRSLKDSNEEQRTASALKIYRQMAHALSEMKAMRVAFPDMKNHNWLIDADDQLMISDTKSLLCCENNGLIEPSIARGNYFISSPLLAPPDPFFHTDTAEVYMLGKNLYDYLVNSSNAEDFKFRSQGEYAHPIFLTTEGQDLRGLIKDLTAIKACDRPSLEDAESRLKAILYRGITPQADREKLAALSDPSPLLRRVVDLYKNSVDGELDDDLMIAFLNEKQKQIAESSGDYDALRLLCNELQAMIDQSAIITMIKEAMDNLKEGSSISASKRDKITQIERAIGAIPVTDRHRIMEPHYEPGLAVQRAIASHRHFSFVRSLKVTDGMIDSKGASESFRKLKEKIETMKASESPKPDFSSGKGPGPSS